MEIIEKQVVYESRKFCHGATIVVCENELICAWFAGEYEGHRESSIYLARGKQWSSISRVISSFETQGVACWNPVLFNHDKRLILFYKTGIMPSRWCGVKIESEDYGKNWSDPQKLPQGIVGPTKNKPLALAGNEFVCGSSRESPYWQIYMEYCDGKSWIKSPPLNDKSLFLIQPTITRCHSGKILALFRSSHDFIYQSYSSDDGKNWSLPQPTTLPNPNSGIDMVTLKSGDIAVAYNHSSKNRYPLSIAISSNEGCSWEHVIELESEPHKEGYSYPSIIQASDEKIHIVYSWKCRKIYHVVLDQSRF
ncbi:exo-alpha-sialidase [Candidatus Uabimicrobium sp. HlEnr_7]|uniref:sialidase family protein n=1 Tax=Candidatus Uabimicrobium helgolandensis TaxID=3095367 RepID=UPI0035563D6F